MQQNKSDIRAYMKNKRGSIDTVKKSKMDDNIINSILKSEDYKKAKVIFTYISFGSEINTKTLIEHAFNDNKTVCVPKVISKKLGMKAVRVADISELKVNKMGILEPEDDTSEVSSDIIDLVIVPGLAFDLTGYRIGYGGGFYDKFFEKCKASLRKVAICYEFQLIDKVPSNPLDMPIDEIITEKTIYEI